MLLEVESLRRREFVTGDNGFGTTRFQHSLGKIDLSFAEIMPGVGIIEVLYHRFNNIVVDRPR